MKEIDILLHVYKLIKLADSSGVGIGVVTGQRDWDDEDKKYRAQIKADQKIRQERYVRSRSFPIFNADY